MPEVTINMSSAHRKMIFTTIMLIPCFLMESFVMSMSSQERPYESSSTGPPPLGSSVPKATPSSLTSRSYNNFRLHKSSNENYDPKKDEGIFEDSSSDNNRDSEFWPSSPRKQYRYYGNRYEPLATAASSQYTSIYRNRNLFVKPKNWISRKREEGDDSILYYSSGGGPGRSYESRGVYQTAKPFTSTEKYTKTTAEPRTAPATEVSAVTERPTTTHEMQHDKSEFDAIYHETTVTDKGSSYWNGRGRTPGSGPGTDHYSGEVTERQDRTARTHFPNDNDPIVFPTTPIFGKEYLRPTGENDQEVNTVKPLNDADFAELRVLIEARKKTEVDNRNSASNIHNQLRFKPPVCKDPNGYCTDSSDYPKDALNSILESSLKPAVFQKIFGDSLDNSSMEAQELSGRIDLPQEQPLCASVEHTIYPKVAKNKEGKYMYVVNHDEYIQGVKVEKCLGENGGCQFSDGSPTGYQTSCRQKYIYKKLLAFNDQGKALTDTFRLPSCCVCYIKSSFISDRFNSDSNPGKQGTTANSPKKNQIRDTSAPTSSGSSTTANNLLITSNDEAVPTELPDSESLAGRTDKVVDNTNLTATINHDNFFSDNYSSSSSSSTSSTSKSRIIEENVAKSGSARSF